jgi:hypothetical protein
MVHFNAETLRFKLELMRFNIKLGRFNTETKYFNTELIHFNHELNETMVERSDSLPVITCFRKVIAVSRNGFVQTMTVFYRSLHSFFCRLLVTIASCHPAISILNHLNFYQNANHY